MKKLEHITIIIPLRIDSEKRRTNLDAVLDYLCKYRIKIMLLEADAKPQYKLQAEHSDVMCRFVEDYDTVFYRTHYLNCMLHEVRTPVAGIWDSDGIVPIEQIIEATRLFIADATLCYPFDGRFFAVSDRFSRLYKETGNFDILSQNESMHWLMHGMYSVGRRFCCKRKKILVGRGGENEHFYRLGPEDTERRERIAKLGLKVNWVQGCLYHLFHPRGMNSNFAYRERELSNRREYLKICRMNRQELEEYISTWPCTNKKSTPYATD